MELDITISQIPSGASWFNVFQFTIGGKGGNNAKFGDRIPGLWITKNSQIVVATALNNKKNLMEFFDIVEGPEPYHVVIEQYLDMDSATANAIFKIEIGNVLKDL